MFLNYSFIGVCLLFGTLSQAIPIIKSETFKVFQTRSIHQRDSTPSSSFHLIDEEKPKIENKVKIDTVKSVDGRLTSEEISIDLKQPFDDLNSDHKLTGMANKSVVESLSDQKHSETNSKLSKALTLERRQNHKSSSYLSEEEKSTIAKSRTETRAKIDAVIDAGGEITIEEISVVSKEAIAENENSDRKTIGKAIKNAVEDLADRKLAELKDKIKLKIVTLAKVDVVIFVDGIVTPKRNSKNSLSEISKKIKNDFKTIRKDIKRQRLRVLRIQNLLK